MVAARAGSALTVTWPAISTPPAGGRPLDGFGLGVHPAGHFGDAFSGGGQGQPPAAAIDQPDAQFLLEGGDTARHRGMLDGKLAGRSGQGAASRQDQEVPQVLPVGHVAENFTSVVCSIANLYRKISSAYTADSSVADSPERADAELS